MDLKKYRNSEKGKLRIRDLIRMLPDCRGRAINIEDRDGFFSEILTKYFLSVVALDFEKSLIVSVKGLNPRL